MITTSAPTMLNALIRIPIDQVEAGPNARGDVGDVGELALSIKQIGMQKPLLVYSLGDGRYRVLDGHRRLAAARVLGLQHVDAVLRRDGGAKVRIQQQLAMHAQAKAFDPIAEARALSALMFDHNLSREEIARAVGKSAGWVRDRIGLLQLDPDEQESVSKGSTTVSTALATVSMRRAHREGRAAKPGWLVNETVASQPKRHCRTCSCDQAVATS